MTNLSETIVQFCKAAGLRMNTDLGQHFLIDEEILEKILTAAHIQKTDHIVEIGAGIGILTKELLKRANTVTSIEIDPRMVPLISKYIDSPTSNELTNKRINESPGFTLINANALSVPFPAEPYKIVANIPYHITSPLLRHAFLEGTRSPVSLTLLIQREVAEKICDSEDMSMLTVIVALFGSPRIITNVPPAAFLPPPKVDSAVLHIDCFESPKADTKTIETLFMLTKHAFSQKRKMLRNTIYTLPGGEEAMKRVGIDATRRPQTLSIEEWIALAQAIKP